MNDPHQPNDPAKQTPEQESSEQFGKLKHGGRAENQPDGRSDMPRGSEVEARANSRKRG